MIKCILCIVETKEMKYDLDYQISELTNLCNSLDIFPIHVITQKLPNFNKATYIGSGKLEELKEAIDKYNPNIVVCNDELSPSQLRNLEEYLDIEIIDRTLLILDIFAKNARTKEAILDINLVKAKYMLPRLKSLNSNMDRQGGGLHNKGAGETKLELDRRVLLSEIRRNEESLRKLKTMKELQIKKRESQGIPIVALVGYTNAGKSTTMNTLLSHLGKPVDKLVYAKDELFATLNTSSRLVEYNKHQFILIDTVGFVSNLPHNLVNSFKQTLMEIKSADLIIHVLDISTRFYEEQYEITENVLNSLGIFSDNQLLLLNKYDLYQDNNYIITGVRNMPYSNKTLLNLDKLLDYIYEATKPYMIELKLNVPYQNGKIMSFIEEKAIILSKVFASDYASFHIKIDKKYLHVIQAFEENSDIN